MPLAEFEPAVPAIGRPQTHGVDHAATGFGVVYLLAITMLVTPTFLYGSENWTLTALQRRRIEAAEMKLLSPLAGFMTTKQMTPYAVNYRLNAY